MRGRISALVWALAAVLFTVALVLYPKDALEAAKEGLNLFLNIVFPSLLPFFILADVMQGLGVVHFIGVLFEPLMRPLFNVPGEGAFVLSMGLAAGYPMDAVITARFRKQQMCSRTEGERMLAFSNTADPLFIFGAVAVGMFGMPALGKTMALAHYLAALVVGLTFRFYRSGSEPVRPECIRTGNIVGRAIEALVKARREDGRLMGQLLGDTVKESIQTLWMICGFIMLFATLVKIIDAVGVYPFIALPFEGIFRFAEIDLDLVRATVAGLFEIDLGTMAAAKASADLVQQVAIAGAIIAWSGLSVHGQIASVLTGTDIRITPYIAARVQHAVFAYLFTIVLLPASGVIEGGMDWVVPVLGGLPQGFTQLGFWEALMRGASLSVAVPLGLTAIGVASAVCAGGLRWFSFRHRRS